MLAVRDDFTTLQFAADRLRADREVVLSAVREDGLMLEYAAEKLKRDRDLALIAIEQDWRAMQFLPDDLRADRKLVLTAVKRSGLALQFAAPKLQADWDTALAALEDQPSAVQYVSKQLLADHGFALAAMKRTGLPLSHVGGGLQSDPAIQAAASTNRQLNVSAETARADELAAHCARLEAALRRQRELAEALERQRMPQDLHGLYSDNGWTSEIIINRASFVDASMRIEGSVRYKFVRGPASRTLPPVGSLANEKLLGDWRGDTFVGHGVSSDAQWLAPAPKIHIQFDGDRCDWCRVTVGKVSCDLTPEEVAQADMGAEVSTSENATAALVRQKSSPGQDEDALLRQDVFQLASALGEEDLHRFVHSHIAGELDAIRALPHAQRSRAFRALCFQWHPDKCPLRASLATQIFQLLQAQKESLLSSA